MTFSQSHQYHFKSYCIVSSIPLDLQCHCGDMTKVTSSLYNVEHGDPTSFFESCHPPLCSSHPVPWICMLAFTEALFIHAEGLAPGWVSHMMSLVLNPHLLWHGSSQHLFAYWSLLFNCEVLRDGDLLSLISASLAKGQRLVCCGSRVLAE